MSQPPERPGSPSDPWGGEPKPGDYPPPPGYGPPPGPPPGYGPPPGPPPGYGPPPAYGAPPPGYGGPPPPPGYGPPPPGYGPPPPGYGPPQPGYGPPPGYPPPPGYAAPQPGFGPPPGYPPPPGLGFNIGDAFSWAWDKFAKHLGPLILSILLYNVIAFVVLFVAGSLVGFRANVTDTGTDTGQLFTGVGVIGTLVLEIVIFVVVIFVQAGYLSGVLDIADGNPVTIGSFFRPRHFGAVILAAALLGVVSIAVLALQSVVPGFLFWLLTHVVLAVFGFFAIFTIAFSTDRGLTAFAALTASFTTVRSNIGGALVSALAQFVLFALAMLPCFLGLVTLPLALLIQVYTYRRLSGGSVAPLTP
jgi:uncharacterized membrane protein